MIKFRPLQISLIALLLIFCLTFAVYSADLYGTYDNRLKITIDHNDIDSDLTWFPVTIFLTNTQGEEVFTEFDADEDFDRIAITTSDGVTQIYGDCELFDDSEQKAIYHVAKTGVVTSSSADTDYYIYYDNDADHNTTYIGKSGILYAPPRVTFVFDDGEDDVYDAALPLFNTQGEVACAAIVTDWVGGETAVTWEEVAALQSAGWEILNHSKTHTDMTTLNEAQITAEIEDSETAFTNNSITTNNFVYPYEKYNDLVINVVDNYFNGARGNTLHTANTPDNMNQWIVRSYITDDHTEVATYKGYVDSLEKSGGWLCFYMHTVDSNDEDMLDELIDYIQAKNIDIITFQQGLDLYDKYCNFGSNAEDRTTTTNPMTIVDSVNAANASGKVYKVEIYPNEAMSDVEVATFYVESGNNLSTRDTYAIGSVAAGKQTFYIDLDVTAGDYIGIYFSAGKIEQSGIDTGSMWYKSGDNIPCTNTEFSTQTTPISLKAYVADVIMVSHDVYDSNFKAVYHMNDNTTSTILDSTSNANHGTKKAANEPVEATGKVGQGQDFDGSDDDISLWTYTGGDTAFTIEAVFNAEGWGQSSYGRLVCARKTTHAFDLYLDGNSGHETVTALYWGETTNSLLESTAGSIDLATWYYTASVLNAIDSQALYINGSSVDTDTVDIGTDINACDAPTKISNRAISNDREFEGIIDEVRISNTGRTAAWIAATYDSLYDTLLTYGSEETSGEEEAVTNVLFLFSNF